MKINYERLASLPPEQRKEAEEALAQLGQAYEQNPLLRYEPHPKQAAFHQSTRRRKMFVGGNRSGKTTAGIIHTLIQCVDAECLPEKLQAYKKWEAPINARMIAPKFNENHERVTFPKIREWAPKAQLRGGSWEKAFSKSLRVLTFENGSTIQFLTFEQDIDAHAGADLHIVLFDEEPPGEKGRQMYHENRGRLIDHAGDLMVTMTPLFGMSWAYEDFWEARGEETKPGVWDDEKLTVVRVGISENPHLPEEARDEFLEGLTTEEREARAEGKFVHFAGLVLSEWQGERHKVDMLKVDHARELDTLVGIDPGIRTTAVVFAGFDRDNCMWIYDELYLHDTDAIPENVTKRIRAVEQKWGVKPLRYVIDPSARNRTLETGNNIISAYARAGIRTALGNNAVEAGIFELKRRMQSEPPLLKVAENCTNWLWERSRYRHKPKESDQSAFDVVKKDDHLVDASRYLAQARPLPRERPRRPPEKPSGWQYGTAPPADQPTVPETEPPPLGAFA